MNNYGGWGTFSMGYDFDFSSLEEMYSLTKDHDVDEIENLGKPLTLQQILLALNKRGNYYLGLHGVLAEEDFNGIHDIDGFDIPPDIEPSHYPEELIKQLIELTS